uniref:Uncharacterized protein n=1 Tax=Candidatus Kentrum sp. FW TaxID=2126338 RepID=A0A450TEK4_9GAMM|nr:MAG: hypothetical protein BECKFW1821C_GA0114237_100765 [Candidatus Kentron sp. FW]
MEITDPKGRIRKRYPYDRIMTPYDKLKSLPDAEHHLKPNTTFQQLDAIAYSISDNDAALLLNQAKAELFRFIYNSQNSAA